MAVSSALTDILMLPGGEELAERVQPGGVQLGIAGLAAQLTLSTAWPRPRSTVWSSNGK